MYLRISELCSGDRFRLADGTICTFLGNQSARRHNEENYGKPGVVTDGTVYLAEHTIVEFIPVEKWEKQPEGDPLVWLQDVGGSLWRERDGKWTVFVRKSKKYAIQPSGTDLIATIKKARELYEKES